MPVISTNTAANSAVRYLNINAKEQSDSLSKLASGSRITQASDDAAGLAISTRISSDVATLNQAATNASHGISVLQTADGGASNISDILERMKSLATEAASGTVTDDDRTYIDAEFQELVDQVDTIATGTRYNGESLLDGSSAFNSADGGTAIVVGSSSDDTINVSITSLTATDLGLVASSDEAASLDVSLSALESVDLSDGDLTLSFTGSDGTESVTIDDTADTDSDGKVSADELATALTTALDGAGASGIKATLSSDGKTLTFADASTTNTGADTKISLSVASTNANTSITTMSDLGVDVSSATGRDSGDSLNVLTQDGANAVLDKLDTAIDTVSKVRAEIGAQESRFEFTSDSIATSVENLTAAGSAITDVDVASEEAKLASSQVKVQAAVAAASSANQMTQNLLKLLQ
jgi:flagellin